ncbi:MAG: HD domain-containing phosphohydrolase [Candidatus Acidiferrales bacterium]
MQRTLLSRLAAVTAVTVVLVAGVAYVTQRSLLEEEAAEHARTQVAHLQARTRALLAATPEQEPTATFRQALDELVEARAVRRSGHFIYVRFYDPTGAIIVEVDDPSYPPLAEAKNQLAPSPQSFPRAEEIHTDLLRVSGHPHIVVVLPVTDRTGTVVAYGEGIFAVSDAAVAAARWRLARNVALAVAIVFATALLLYPVISQLLRRLAEFSTALLDANLETLSLLGSAIAKRDSDTDAHNYRVTLYAVRLAEARQLPAADIRILIKGGFLHDVGKIGIRDSVLLKPGRLTEDEYAVMKKHVDHALDIVRRSRWLWEASVVVGGHHEKYDGSGYPAGVKGRDIPVTARIFAIADVFDALTSRRPYKEALSLEAALDVLEQGRGTHFDPELLDAFRQVAPDLHRQYAACKVEQLAERLEQATAYYFAAALETLPAL